MFLAQSNNVSWIFLESVFSMSGGIDSINFSPRVRHPKFDIENLIRLTFVSTKPVQFYQLKARLEMEIENLIRN